MSHYLRIGPIRFVLKADNAVDVTYTEWGYRAFFDGASEAERADPCVEMEVQVSRGAERLPPGAPLYEGGRNWAIWEDGDGYVICSRYADREGPRYWCRVSRELDRAELRIDGDPLVDPLCYPIDQILSWGLLARCGGILLHAALVAHGRSGLLLAGCSGAGKSTLAALCRAEGWRGINDDRAILYDSGAGVQAAGTPWHGTGRLAEAVEVEPVGIILLEQAHSNRLEAMASDAAKLALLKVVSVPWFEPEWSQGILDALDTLVDRIPVYRFFFTKDASAVRELARLVSSQE